MRTHQVTIQSLLVYVLACSPLRLSALRGLLESWFRLLSKLLCLLFGLASVSTPFEI